MPIVEINGEEPVLLKLIGSGARFPWNFDGTGGSARIKVGGGMDRINGSISHILSTRIGERFMQPDFGCLAGDTMIPLLDGRTVPIGELAGSNSEPGYVYSYDLGSKRVRASSATASLTAKAAPVLRVTLADSDGTLTSVRCTEDHPFLTLSGLYIEAKNLSKGIRLMPLYRRQSKTGYEEVLYPETNKWQRTYVVSAQSHYGDAAVEGAPVVHHADFSKTNNDPRNLVLFDSPQDHIRYHAEHNKEMHADPSSPLRQGLSDYWSAPADDVRKVNLAASATKTINSVNERYHQDEEFRQKVIEAKMPTVRKWQENPWSRTPEGKAKCAETLSRVMRKKWAEDEEYRAPTLVRLAEYRGNTELTESGRSRMRESGKLQAKRLHADPKMKAFYREHARELGLARRKFFVSEDRLFSLVDSFLATQNRLPTVKEAALLCETSVATFKRHYNASDIQRLNHVVVSVEPDGYDDVFDLHVPDLNSFALSAGVFVHNSNLPDLVFEPLDDILRQQLFMYTVAALKKWEKRIIVEAVAFEDGAFTTDQSTIYIFIEYRLINSQVRGNFVYPFERGGRPVSESFNGGL